MTLFTFLISLIPFLQFTQASPASSLRRCLGNDDNTLHVTASAIFMTYMDTINSQEEAYVYHNMPRMHYMHTAGGIWCTGTIDSEGHFQPIIDDLQGSVRAILKGMPRAGSWPSHLHTGKVNEKVYEYRSGLLVPMIVDPKLGLLPEVGGKIIDFKNYKYSSSSVHIYNLPGRFVREGDAAIPPHIFPNPERIDK